MTRLRAGGIIRRHAKSTAALSPTGAACAATASPLPSLLVKPAGFDYAAPGDKDGVLSLLAEEAGATLLAGGQSLIPLLNLRLARPPLIVDLRRVSELRGFSTADDGLTVAAMTPVADLEDDPGSARVPGVQAALRRMAHPQIRSRSTIGGSVSHADPAAELPALLLALEGAVQVESRKRGSRWISAADFFLGPFTTARMDDELVTEVRFPRFAGSVVVSEMTRRRGDFAIAGVVAGIRWAGTEVAEARIALFGVGGTQRRAAEAEMMAAGTDLSDDTIEAIAGSLRRNVDALDDIHASASYRRDVAATLLSRSLRELRRG